MELLDDKDGVSPSGWVSYYRLNEKHPTILSIFLIFLPCFLVYQSERHFTPGALKLCFSKVLEVMLQPAKGNQRGSTWETCCLSARSVSAQRFDKSESFFSISAQNVSWRREKEHSGYQSRSRSEGNKPSHKQSLHSLKTNFTQKYFSTMFLYISFLVASLFNEVNK